MFENPPVALMLVPLPLVFGAAVGFVLGFATGSWLWGIVGFVVAALAIAAAAYTFAETLALRLLKARPLAESGSLMLRNQLEELCARTGLAEPDLYTVGPGAPAIASVGRSGNALVVTDGLVDDLTVVELEAAVARELARAQSGSTTVDTLAVPFLTLPFGMLGTVTAKALDFFRGGDHDARTDLDGIAITRYPPGMSAALAKMGAAPAAASKAVAHLWAVGRGDTGAAGSFGIDERLAMLQEL
jgi:heat shock protein HtpX